MYKIIELNERDIEQFNGKIIQVIDSGKKQVAKNMGCYGAYITRVWSLTCLVEIKRYKKKKR